MILAVAATEFEMNPFVRRLAASGRREGTLPCCFLTSGVGPVETTLRLTRFLERCDVRIDCVLHFGVAGAYVPDVPGPEEPAGLLDLCLAQQECLGDFGICYADRVEPLDLQLTSQVRFPLDQFLRDRAGEILAHHGHNYRRGNFVTVSAVSATRARGAMLAARFDGLCENMEGAAATRVCAEFSLPMLEVRAISNLVEDRDLGRWQLAAACDKAAGAAALLACELERI